MNNLIETICEDSKVRYTRGEDWVISNEANIELESFDNRYTTIL